MNPKTLVLITACISAVSLVIFLELNEKIFADSDNDGIIDEIDNCPNHFNIDQTDSDMDKIGDFCDIDDDNDQVIDEIDQFDNDDSEWADYDFDGVGSNADNDDDNDGVLDDFDPSPTTDSGYLARKYFKNIENCVKTDESTLRLVCYSDFFKVLTENERNFDDALELSIALSKIGTVDDCHFISHQIGHESFDSTRDVGTSLYGMDGTMCRGGYYHGVLSSYFHSIKETEISFPNSVDTICSDLIGSSNYQDCIHGLGHGFVHYFGNDLESSLKQCHSMSFYQNMLCVKGVMMQYTENVLTRDGISQISMSNLCDSNSLTKADYIECAMSTGSTITFFTSHSIDEGIEKCNLIDEKKFRNYCIEGVKLEIQDAETYQNNPLTQNIREKFQPQIVDQNKIIDIRSNSIISDFTFVKQIGFTSFSIDEPGYFVLYIPVELASEKMIVTVNNQIPKELKINKHWLNEEILEISFVTNQKGMVMITPLS